MSTTLLELKNDIIDFVYLLQTSELANALDNLHVPDTSEKIQAVEGIAEEMTAYLSDLSEEIRDAESEIQNTKRRLQVLREYLAQKRFKS